MANQMIPAPDRPTIHSEVCIETVADLSAPIECTLPDTCTRVGVVCRVFGIARRRNNGKAVLTLAVAEWMIPGIRSPHPVTDIVTMMRLADFVSDRHSQPINADRLYGPTGRLSPVGRMEPVSA